MDPNHPNYYHDSQKILNFGTYFPPQNFPNSVDRQSSQYYQNSQFPPNLTQIPSSEELPTTQNISRNFFGNVQPSNQNQKGAKNVSWSVKDVTLMSSYINISTDGVRGNNQKKPALWLRVHKLYHESQAENPNELNPRNIESMKGHWKRLNENVGKWIAALEEAYRRKRSGMSQKDIEMEAHAIYETSGNKFQDLVVYNDVMSKHPRWAASVHDATRLRPEDDYEESGGSNKRSRTSVDEEYEIPSNPETPTTGGSTVSRPTGRDKSKKKGKGKVKESESEVAAELRALRLSRAEENELIAKKLEFESQKLQMMSLKMHKKLLNTLLGRDNLSPEEKVLKRQLISRLFGQN